MTRCFVALVLQERLDLVHPLLILRDIEIFLNNSNKHIQNDDLEPLVGTSYIRWWWREKHTVPKNEPTNKEHGTDPANAKWLLRLSGHVEQFGPIFARENLVHAQKGVPDGVKRHWRGITVKLGRNIAPDYLDSK